MNYGLAGGCAIVAGADGDMGRAMARALAGQTCNVALLGRSEFKEEMSADARSLGDDYGVKAVSVSVDFESSEEIRSSVKDAIEKLDGRLDYLVNNLIIEDKIMFLDTPVESWDRQFRVMARAPYLLTQEAARHMAANAGGSIVNVGSVAGMVFWPRTSAYNAARGALIATTATTALDLAPLGVRVNGIAAGHVETEMETDRLAQPGIREQTLAELPIGRMGIPDDVASAVMFLLSEGAAYIVGQTIVVDGGYILR